MINDAGKHGVKKALSTWKARPLWRQSRAFPRKPNTNVVRGHSGPGNWGTAQDQRGAASGEYESMKSRETLIRLRKFQVDEKRRRVAQIESMIAEFDRIGSDLDREIKAEQDRAGIHDPNHFAYPTYAKAAMQRRENLKRSAAELRTQLDDAKLALDEAFEEMKKIELLEERDQIRERAEDTTRTPGEFMRSA
jgi:flagellar export protein FliJ